jgi:hypothetical protein
MVDSFRMLGILGFLGCSALVAASKPLAEVQLDLEDGAQFTAKMVSKVTCVTDVDPETTFREFFAHYWPLSEDHLKESVQRFFLVWPQEADSIVIDFVSHARTDLNLCDPNAPITHYERSQFVEADYLYEASRSYRHGQLTVMYAGDRKGSLTADPRSGLIRHATWKEELLGIAPLRGPDTDRTEPLVCPSKRTETVSIEIATGGN